MRGCARFCATAHYGNDRALRVCSVVADMRGHAGEVRYRAYSGRPIVVAMRDRARFCATAQKKQQIKRRIPITQRKCATARFLGTLSLSQCAVAHVSALAHSDNNRALRFKI